MTIGVSHLEILIKKCVVHMEREILRNLRLVFLSP
jgi:hypothetical protein